MTLVASAQRGYHPLLAIAAGTGEVLMARLREGRANTARGAAHFLRETVSRVRNGGASGQLTIHHARRQRLLCPRPGRGLPRNGCPLLHHHPSARPPCGISSRRYPRRTGADSLLDGRRRRCGRDHLQSLSQKSKLLKAIDLLTPTFAAKMIISDACPTYPCR